MNTKTQSVDVLAELDRRLEIGALFGQSHNIPAADLTGDAELRAARDAVAELIEAAELARDWIETKGIRLTDGAGRLNLREVIARVRGEA